MRAYTKTGLCIEIVKVVFQSYETLEIQLVDEAGTVYHEDNFKEIEYKLLDRDIVEKCKVAKKRAIGTFVMEF